MAFIPQNFVSQIGPAISAAFANTLDYLANSVFGGATTNPAARTALTADLPLEIANGGTASRTAAGAITSLGITPAAIGALAIGAPPYVITPAETSAGVTIVNSGYLPGIVDRYGTNTTPGTTDMTAAIQAAIDQARLGGSDVVLGPTGIYMTTGPLDCTYNGTSGTGTYGVRFRQYSIPQTNYDGIAAYTRCGIYANHNGYAVFDLTGMSPFSFHDVTVVTNTTSYPKTCFLTARNSTGESNFPRFFNARIAGNFSIAVLYNYGSEDGVYVGNYWFNYATDAGAKCVVLTAYNIFGLTSSFVTIVTGGQSTLDHNFSSGQYALINASATSRYLLRRRRRILGACPRCLG